MERFLGEDSIFLFFGAMFTLVMAIRAWRRGALESIWSLASWTSGAASGWWIYNSAPQLLDRYADVRLGQGAAFVASLVMAVLTFALVRKLARTLLDRVFGPGTLLGGWMYGGTGSIVSTLPSFAVIVCLALVIRVSGTLLDLNQIDRLTASREKWTKDNLPEENLLARWRDAIEGLPKGAAVLDLVDPLSTVPRRNLAAVLLASFNPYVRTRLWEWPGMREIALHPRVRQMVDRDLELNELIAGQSAEWKYYRLLCHPTVTDALRDEGLRKALTEVDAMSELRALLSGQSPKRRLKWLERITG
jgi:hypothetical protein